MTVSEERVEELVDDIGERLAGEVPMHDDFVTLLERVIDALAANLKTLKES